MKPWRPDYGKQRCSACGGWTTSAPSLCCGAKCKPAPQAAFLSQFANVFEVLNAGGVGSGKTDAGIMAPVVYLEYRRSQDFKGVIFRHNENDLAKEILTRIERPNMYRAYAGGGPLNKTAGTYRTKAGGYITFGHAKNLNSLQGAQWQYAWFDELTHWSSPEAYLYVGFTRLRSATGLPIRLRAGTNATGPGKRWVKARWGPWLMADYLDPPKTALPEVHRGAAQLRALGYKPRPGLPPLDSGAVLHYVVDEEGRETYVPAGTPGALTRSCLRTRTEDNPALADNDPLYAMRLRAAGAVLYRQLAKDDWDADEADEEYFKRDWFRVVSLLGVQLVGCVRRWDFAWTKRRKSDWTVGVKLGWTADGHYYVLDVRRLKGTPDEVKKEVRATAELDGRDVPVVVPLNYADSLYVLDDLVRELAGYQVVGQKEAGAKEVRIATLQPQAQANRVHLAGGPWVDTFLEEIAAYRADGKAHDDQLDALAGAFLHLVDSGKVTVSLEQLEASLAHGPALAEALGVQGERDQEALDDDDEALVQVPSLTVW